MAVDVSLHGIAESYRMVVDDDRRLGKVVSVIYKSVFFNYSQNIFQFLMNVYHVYLYVILTNMIFFLLSSRELSYPFNIWTPKSTSQAVT